MNIVLKNVFSVVLICAAAITFSSCARTSSKIAFHEEANKDEDAVIYFYRLSSMVGSVGHIGWPVIIDGKRVAYLNQNAYVVFHMAPGPHLVSIGEVGYGVIDQMVREKGTFTAEKNGIYYFRNNGFTTDFVPKETAMTEIVKMKFDMGCGTLSPCVSY
jgi:hypothetical protein